MFTEAIDFNQSISDWNTSSVTDMRSMFSSINSEHTFNHDISRWDTSSVTNMDGMFYGARDFSYCLKPWDVHQITTTPPSFALNSGLDSTQEPIWGTTGESCVSSSSSSSESSSSSSSSSSVSSSESSSSSSSSASVSSVSSSSSSASVSSSSSVALPASSSLAPSSLYGYVWIDEDGDGEQDELEQNLFDSDIKVSLIKGSYVLNRIDVNASGEYLFENLKEGEYTLYFSSQESFSIGDEVNISSYKTSIYIARESEFGLALDAYGSDASSSSVSSSASVSSSSESSSESSSLSSSVSSQSSSTSSSESSTVATQSASSQSSLSSSQAQQSSQSFEPPEGIISSSSYNGAIYWRIDWYNRGNSGSILVKFIHHIQRSYKTRSALGFDSLTCSIDGMVDEHLCSVDENGDVVVEGFLAPDTTLSVQFRTPTQEGMERIEVSATGLYDENGDGALDGSDANVALSNNSYSQSVDVTASSSSEAMQEQSEANEAIQEVAIPLMDNTARWLLIVGFLVLAYLSLRKAD